MRYLWQMGFLHGTIWTGRFAVSGMLAILLAAGIGEMRSACAQQFPGSSQVWSPLGPVTQPGGAPQQNQPHRGYSNVTPGYSMPSSVFNAGQIATPGLINPVVPRSGPYVDPRRGNNPSIPLISSPFGATRGSAVETVEPESPGNRQPGEEAWSGVRPTRGNLAPERFQTREPGRSTGVRQYPITTFDRSEAATGRKRPRPLIVEVVPVPATPAPLPSEKPVAGRSAENRPTAQPAVPAPSPSQEAPKSGTTPPKAPSAFRPVTKEQAESESSERLTDPVPPSTIAVKQRPLWSPPPSPYDDLPTASRPVAKEQADYDQLDVSPGSGPLTAERTPTATRR